MALETLKDCVKIGGFKVIRAKSKHLSWDEFDQMRASYPIHITDSINAISFKIQDGPVTEVGVNGCDVDTMIHAAKEMLWGLNYKFPCAYNEGAIACLVTAIKLLQMRTKDRERRKVEGTS
jgi:hypothetical protein